MSNTANSRQYKARVNMTIKVPNAGQLDVVVRRNVYFRKSDGSPYIEVKGRRKDIVPTNNPAVRYAFVEVLQRSR